MTTNPGRLVAENFDLVIIGMGSGGLVAAEFACGLGVKVAVIERGRVGGNSLWTGGVPTKALSASAKVAHTIRQARSFGLEPVDPEIDTGLVFKRIHSIQLDIAGTDDDPERFRDMGVELICGSGRLDGPERVEVTAADGSVRMLDTRFVLVCTGSRPVVPAVAGLAEAGYLTSESLFDRGRAPESIIVIGTAPAAIEMAQAFARLGVRTAAVQSGPSILPHDEPELVQILERVLMADGVDLALEVELDRVSVEADGSRTVHGRQHGQSRRWCAAELLVVDGRAPQIGGLGLEEAGVAVSPEGIEVDDRLRSSVPSVYAAGDVAGRYTFTHSAAYEAVRAVRDMFFPGKGRATEAVPWCTFTDPELAHAGMTVTEAEERLGDDVQVWRLDLTHSDRARADGTTSGAIVVVTHKNKVVGAHVLAPCAGEMIHELTLAIREGVTFSSLGGLIHVYPTLSTGIMQLAGEAAFEKAESFRWLVKKGRR